MVVRWFERHNKVSWIITLFGAIAIFYISSITFQPEVAKINLLSIIYHFFAFFFFALFLGISSLRGHKKYNVLILVIILSIVYGVLDELHQYFVPGRKMSLFDVGVDTLGILFALLVYTIRIKIKNNVK